MLLNKLVSSEKIKLAENEKIITGSFIYYVHKIFRKTDIYYPLKILRT